MKNKLNLFGIFVPNKLKMQRVMKLITGLLFVVLINVSAKSYSQVNKISARFKNSTLLQVFEVIEEKTNYSIIYNDESVRKSNYQFTQDFTDADVFYVLEKVLDNSDFNFQIINDAIIIKPNKLEAQARMQQQGHTVKGVVIDKSGDPLPGVNVYDKGNPQRGVITGVDGSYAIDLEKGEGVLVFSFIGFDDQEINVAGRSQVNITLLEEATGLDEVVVIGYGTAKKSDLTGAVASVSGQDLQADISKSVASAMQGRIAGVSVTASSGQPGSALNINIRGLSSLRNNTPLFVIDGVYADINDIDPADIASMEVLKDASAAAIYGSRAANGVVIITTNSGKKNTDMKVNVNTFTGVQSVPQKLDLLNGEEWVNVMNNAGIDLPIKSFSGPGTNWQDEVYRTAPITKANVGFNGGTSDAKYSVSAGYMDQRGILLDTGYKTFNVRAKTTFSLWEDRLTVGETLIVKTAKRDNYTGNMTAVFRIPSTVPVYDEERIGGYAAPENWMKNLPNPVGDLMARTNQDYTTNIILNGFAELKLLEGLKYKLNVGLTNNTGRNYNRKGVFDFGSYEQNYEPDLSESASFSDSWLVENTLHYNKAFGKHNISAVAGYTAQKWNYRGFSANRDNLLMGTDVISAGDPGSMQASGSAHANTLVSYLGRVMYNFDSKYLLSVSFRRDGSSRFADGYRYGTFPSASLGWNMHHEEFFSDFTHIVNQFKVRASYGVLGNQEIGNYLTQKVVTSGINYVVGTPGENLTWWQGRIPDVNWSSPVDLTWEETATLNFGADIGFLGNKLNLTLDIFNQQTENVLLGISMPASTGKTGSPVLNAGSIENKGVEIALSHRNKVGEFNYHVGLNFSALNNKVTEVNVGSKQEFPGPNLSGEGVVTWAKVGDPIGAFYVIKTDGIFQSNDEVLAHSKDGNLIQPNAEPGDIRFVDFNNDGQINDEDRQYVGSAFPDFSLGLTAGFDWKGLDMNLFFDGVFGNTLYNYARVRTEQMLEVQNFASTVKDAWTPTNTNTDMPRFVAGDPNGNARRVSDRWIEDGTYFRLKTLELGYTLTDRLLTSNKIDRLRIYTAFENLFTITNYTGYTPDLGQSGSVLTNGVDAGRYPVPRTFMIGLQLDF
jgi:TonB-linked SusC/RagA family outer membrane protein